MGGGVTGRLARQRSDLIGDHGARAVVLSALAIDGVLCALATSLFLPLYLGSVPFPISAVIAGVVNLALVWAGTEWATSTRLAALPLWTWLLTVAALTLGGPGGDIVFSGSGIGGLAPILLIAVGAGPAGWFLWRRSRPAGGT